MSKEGLQLVAGHVLEAVKAISVLRFKKALPEDVLNAFWCLQDLVHQLVSFLEDHPADLRSFAQEYPNIVASIFEVLSRRTGWTGFNLPAVNQACASINQSLIELQRIKELQRMEEDRKFLTAVSRS